MAETLSLRRIFHRFFPRKAVATTPVETKHWDHLSIDQKKELALETLIQGELALLQGNLNALSLFETAAQLDPENPRIWYREGLAFFEYGSEEGKEKALLLASRHFKIALQLDSNLFDAWVAWGNVLLQLGRFHDEHHFHLEAKEKYQKAIHLIQGQPAAIVAELYWDFGIVWNEIARHSGEALDFRLAIQAFQDALKHQKQMPSEFWNDFGNAYLELALLVNDQRLFLLSIETLQEAVDQMPHYTDGWKNLGEAYAQLYLNTMDERFANKASDAYARASRLSPKDATIWLSWAQLLSETGKLNKNSKSLVQSIEHCARAATLDPKDSGAIGQWVESLSHFGALSGRLDLIMEGEQKILKATEQFPDDPELWHAYGICLMALARYFEDPEYYDLAIEKLQTGLSIDRTNAELWHALGTAHKQCADLTNEESMLERAARFLSKAIDLKPACPSLLFDTASALFRYSEEMCDASMLEQSLALFESLLQNHRSALLHHPEWLFEYGCALDWFAESSGEEKDFLRAIEIFSHVLLIDPDYPRIHHQIALTCVQLAHFTEEVEHYKRALHYFRLGSRQDEENDALWLDWGLCLIHLAQRTLDTEFMDQLYLDAELKLTKAGQLGNPQACYQLACLYSLLGQTDQSMDRITKALDARTLPTIDEMLDDEWLDNLRATPQFTQFLSVLEAKLQAREQ